MSIYRWQQPSLIRQVEITGPKQHPVALIEASPGASPQMLQAIPAQLRAQGFTATPDMVGGRPVLRVQAFRQPDILLSLLAQGGFTIGEPQIEQTPEKKLSFSEQVKKNSLTYSGYGYMLADAILVASGVARGDMAEATAGLMWGTGGTMLGVFGKQDEEKQLARLYSQLGQFLDQEKVPVPQPAHQTIQTLGQKGGFVEKFHEFLTTHPTQIACTIWGTGGLSLMQAGINQNNPYKAASGALVAAGFYSGLLVNEQGKHHKKGEEQKQEPEKPKSFSEDPIGWFFQKPLRFGGIAALIGNVSILFGSMFFERGRNAAMREAFQNPEGTLELGGMFQKKRTVNIQQTLDKVAEFKGRQDLSPQTHGEWKAALADAKEIESWRASVFKGKDNYKFNMAAAMTNMVANVLVSMSSKDTSQDLDSSGRLTEVVSVAASVIAAQPPDVRAKVIDRMAGFLAQEKDIPYSGHQLAVLLNQKIEELSHNPWLAPGQSLAAAQQQTLSQGATLR